MLARRCINCRHKRVVLPLPRVCLDCDENNSRWQPRFLQIVRVRHFARVQKAYEVVDAHGNRADVRHVVKTPNNTTDQTFWVIGQTQLKEGHSDYWGHDEPVRFVEHRTVVVYIVANTIGKRYRAMAEDLVPVMAEGE